MGGNDDARRVLEVVRGTGLLTPDRPLVAMVSGGRDSVCLLDLAVTLCGAERVCALHVNYGLRGADSDADEAFVRELCQRLGSELEVTLASRPQGAVGNLQAWARDARYGAATRVAASRGALVAAGHTATDQVETILYRLASSPGRRALLGMVPRDGLLVRPLLSLTREDTAAYCAARGLAWRDDASNDSDEYARSRVRHGLASALAAVHPHAQENVLRTAALLRDEAAVLDEVVATALAGRDRITLERLAELPPALARLVVIMLAEGAAGRPLPGAGRRLGELLELGRGGGSAALDLGAGVRAIVEYRVLRMSAEPAAPVPAAVELHVPGRVRFGDWEVACELAPAPDAPLVKPAAAPPARDAPGARGAAPPQPLPGQRGMLDADALGGLVLVRPWRVGDRMAPAGLRGTKSLSDLFTDRRVPRARRGSIPIVEAQGRIAWVPGVATGEGFHATPGTRRRVWVSAHRVADPPIR